MADVTWGAKTSEELKKRIGELVEESELTSKDFLERMVQTYEIEKAKNRTPIISNDLDELQSLTKRIDNIYLGIGERINSMMEEKDLQYQNSLEKKDQLILTLQSQINDLKKEKDDIGIKLEEAIEEKLAMSNQSKIVTEEYENRIEELGDANQNAKDLIYEYKEKNEKLSKSIHEYEEYIEENKGIHLKIKQLEESNKNLADKFEDKCEELSRTLKEKKLEIDGIVNSKDKEIENLTAQIDSLKRRQTESMERAMAKADLDKERELLEQEKKFQGSAMRMQEEYNNKTRELLSLLEESKRDKQLK